MNGYVVVGVDGSLVAVRALDWAVEEAVRRGTALRIVCAVADRDEAGPVLASATARVYERHPGVPVESRAVEGGAVGVLAAESTGAALTVVGTRGLGSVTGLLAGSVSWRLAARVHGPLVIVRGDHPCDRAREVLLGLESDADQPAAAYAFQEAARRGARLRVLHSSTHRHITPELPSLVSATSPGQERQSRIDRAEEAVPWFNVAGLREEYPEVEVDSRTVRTGPAHALLSGTREAGVVVIGTRQRTGRLGPPLGPVAQVLLEHAHCPVVLVPTNGGRAQR
jgi:nucleotide-binding universal stress UspA family protein